MEGRRISEEQCAKTYLYITDQNSDSNNKFTFVNLIWPTTNDYSGTCQYNSVNYWNDSAP